MSAALVLAACGDDDDDDDAVSTDTTAASAATAGGADTTAAAGTAAAGTAAAGGDCVVGVSWNNYQEERWAKWDEPTLKAAIEDGGGTYISNDAKSSPETQASNVENLISQGANVLVILAQDGTAILPSVTSAVSQGIPVISYDRLIDTPEALYMSFDNVKVGELQAEAILEVVPEGNFIIIKGNSADANADFLRQGYTNAGIPAEGESSDTITIVGEDYTDNWDAAIAQTTTEQFLTAADNDVEAVLSENDGMAGGVVAALEAQGLAGEVPVSGQDGDQAALNRVALGTQTVDVWKDSRLLGTAAGEAAVQLCREPRHHGRRGHRDVQLPRGQRADLDPPRPAGDHAGQPGRRARCRVDRRGDPLRRRRTRLRRRLRLRPHRARTRPPGWDASVPAGGRRRSIDGIGGDPRAGGRDA